MRFTTSKDTIEKNQTALRIQEMKAAQIAATQNTSKPLLSEAKSKKELLKTGAEETNITMNIQVLAQAFRDLQFKLGYFLETNSTSPQEIMDSWFAQGWQGRIKFAALIDAVLTYGSVNKNDNTSLTHLSAAHNVATVYNASQQILAWLNSETKNLGGEQFEAFQEFPNIPIQDRYKILEQAYWDLLSMKMMGSQILKARFSVLQDLPSDQIQEILSKQDPKLKTMALLHLPQPKIQQIFSSMDVSEKQKMLDESLTLETVSSTDVELADETLKYAVQQNLGANTENGVSFKSLIPNLLSALSVQDEFKMLPTTIAKLSDGGQQLKKTFPSLAFIVEWPDVTLRHFFDQLEIKYITTYLLMAPQMQERVLKIVPPKSAQILADELKSGKKLPDEEMERNLNYLKTRLYRLVNDEVISLNKIFATKTSTNPAKVAA